MNARFRLALIGLSVAAALSGCATLSSPLRAGRQVLVERVSLPVERTVVLTVKAPAFFLAAVDGQSVRGGRSSGATGANAAHVLLTPGKHELKIGHRDTPRGYLVFTGEFMPGRTYVLHGKEVADGTEAWKSFRVWIEDAATNEVVGQIDFRTIFVVA